jgi:hypothetical protein
MVIERLSRICSSCRLRKHRSKASWNLRGERPAGRPYICRRGSTVFLVVVQEIKHVWFKATSWRNGGCTWRYCASCVESPYRLLIPLQPVDSPPTPPALPSPVAVPLCSSGTLRVVDHAEMVGHGCLFSDDCRVLLRSVADSAVNGSSIHKLRHLRCWICVGTSITVVK